MAKVQLHKTYSTANSGHFMSGVLPGHDRCAINYISADKEGGQSQQLHNIAGHGEGIKITESKTSCMAVQKHIPEFASQLQFTLLSLGLSSGLQGLLWLPLELKSGPQCIAACVMCSNVTVQTSRCCHNEGLSLNLHCSGKIHPECGGILNQGHQGLVDLILIHTVLLTLHCSCKPLLIDLQHLEDDMLHQ